MVWLGLLASLTSVDLISVSAIVSEGLVHECKHTCT
jgi:hypothetical protein